jgi:hypothetical protein
MSGFKNAFLWSICQFSDVSLSQSSSLKVDNWCYAESLHLRGQISLQG